VKDEFKQLKGSWEDQVASIDTIEEALDDKGLIQRFVYVMWENGNKTWHPLKTAGSFEQHQSEEDVFGARVGNRPVRNCCASQTGSPAAIRLQPDCIVKQSKVSRPLHETPVDICLSQGPLLAFVARTSPHRSVHFYIVNDEAATPTSTPRTDRR
jgi:hypothetical protein